MKVRSVEARAVLALALAASSFSVADQQPADFQSLYQGHHWFALRDAVEQRKPPQFYRGAVEAAFHQPPQAKRDLHILGIFCVGLLSKQCVCLNDCLAIQYALDTDAAVSLLSESEAKRLGLAMRCAGGRI